MGGPSAEREVSLNSGLGCADALRRAGFEVTEVEIPAALDGAADHFGVTPRTLQRRLRDQGNNFQDMLSEVRMSLAAELLVNSGMPIADVAHAVGLSEASALSRAFVAHYRVTPGTFRRTRAAIPH